jgi:RimJ/RimL family protein N-acetyltransferase
MNNLNWVPVSLPEPVTLRGRWVTLEPLDAKRHAAALYKAVAGHDELWTWLGDGPYSNEEDLHALLAAKQAATGALFFAIVPNATDLAAGYASFMRIKPEHGVAEVGNVLYSPSLQRTPAATEAMYLMANHIFDMLGYRRYEWKCNSENEPSRRAALRLGFSFEGVFRQHMVIKDTNRDTAWFSMLDHEWPLRKQALQAWLAETNFDENGNQRQRLNQFR